MYRCSRSRFHGKETFTRLRRERLASYNIWSASCSKAAKNSKRAPQAPRNSQSASGRGSRPPVRNVTQSATAFGFSRPIYKRKPTFSEMASSGYCPRSEDRGKGTSSRRRFWTSPRLRASDPSSRPLELAAAIRGTVRYKCASTEYRIFRTFSVLPIAPVWIHHCKWDYFLAARAAI